MDMTTTEEQKTIIETFVQTILETEPTYFVVSVKIKPTNNIKIFVDGDEGVTIEKCVQINRKLYKLIEDEGMYPEGEYSLEVSSPGIEEPLKSIRQYTKNIGRYVQITLLDEVIKEGKLMAVQPETVTIEYIQGKGKKALTITEEVSMSNIKLTIVQIKF